MFTIEVTDTLDTSLAAATTTFTVSPATPITSFTIGDLSSLVADGSVVSKPTLTKTPDVDYKSVTWGSSDDLILTPVTTPTSGIKLVAPGTVTLTVTIENLDGSKVTETKDFTLTENSFPRFINDSHQAAPYNPIYVDDTTWKVDNIPVPTDPTKAAVRFFAVWYVKKEDLDNDALSPPTVGQGKVQTWVSSDSTIAKVDSFTAGGRGTHWAPQAQGTALFTATLDTGKVIKLYVGVGQPADVNTTPAAPVALAFTTNIKNGTTTVNDGDPLIFTPVVSGGKTPYTYEWFHDGQKLTGSGYDGSSMGIRTPQGYYADDSAGEYYVKVTDSAGKSIESNHSTIAIHHVIKEMEPSFNRTSGPNANLVLKRLAENSYALSGVTVGEEYAVSVVTLPMAGQDLGALSAPDDVMAYKDTAEAVVDGNGWKFTAKAAGTTKMIFAAANAPNKLSVIVTVVDATPPPAPPEPVVEKKVKRKTK